MKLSRFQWFWVAFAVATLVGILFFLLIGGINGGTAFLLGVLFTSAHFISLKWLLHLWAKMFVSPESSLKPTVGIIAAVVFGLLSLPILVVSGLYIQQIWPEQMTCFLWGLCLVYFALVGWAVLDANPPISPK